MQKEILEKQRFKSFLVQRIKKLRAHLKEKQLDAFLVSAASNRQYLTGWSGDEESGFVLVTPCDSLIITDSRYAEHAIKQVAGFEIIETNEGIGPTLADIAKKNGFESLGFESHDLSVFSLKRLKKFLRSTRLVPVAHLIEELRAVKDETELENTKKAINIAEKAFKHVLAFVKPGRTEREVAWEIERFMREKGAEKMAWEPFIVAAGENSSMAHWGASESKIKKGDQVQLDYGCSYRGYVCDISRMVFVGESTREQRRIYELVLEAQKIGVDLVREGANVATIDSNVRRFLEKNTKHFYKHALGHGVGLAVHEPPSISIQGKTKLVSGNIITIEPGIYIPGWGGVRIEDMVLVTRKGRELLTKAPKKIEEITILA